MRTTPSKSQGGYNGLKEHRRIVALFEPAFRRAGRAGDFSKQCRLLGRHWLDNRRCINYGLGVHELKYKGWGVGYPRNTEIRIDRIVTVDDEHFFTTTNWRFTTNTGSWSTPSGTHDASLISGHFNLVVWVSRESDGELLDAASDSCDI
jgi:hypothetical protein